jgi:type I restriction enzyme M protein
MPRLNKSLLLIFDTTLALMDSAHTFNPILQKGLERGIIAFDNDQKFITYTHRNKKYRFSDPEEEVRAETFCSLVLKYGYKPERIDFEVKVPRRTPSDLADIVIYNDDALKDPYIVIECKKEEVSEAEFVQAIEQGFGNINSLGGHYLVVTSGIKTMYFNRKDYPPMERDNNKIADIPKFGQTKIARYKFVKGGQGGFELETVSEQELTRRFKQAHDALWAGGKRNPSAAFDELDKLIFCKMWDENNDERNDGEPYDFQVFTSRHYTD